MNCKGNVMRFTILYMFAALLLTVCISGCSDKTQGPNNQAPNETAQSTENDAVESLPATTQTVETTVMEPGTDVDVDTAGGYGTLVVDEEFEEIYSKLAGVWFSIDGLHYISFTEEAGTYSFNEVYYDTESNSYIANDSFEIYAIEYSTDASYTSDLFENETMIEVSCNDSIMPRLYLLIMDTNGVYVKFYNYGSGTEALYPYSGERDPYGNFLRSTLADKLIDLGAADAEDIENVKNTAGKLVEKGVYDIYPQYTTVKNEGGNVTVNMLCRIHPEDESIAAYDANAKLVMNSKGKYKSFELVEEE